MSDYEIKDLEDDEIRRIIRKEFENPLCERFVLVGKDNTCLPVYYTKYAESIKNFEVRNSDIFVCSYPKAGTTWTQEMVWLIANNLDFDAAKVSIADRFPQLENSIQLNYENLFQLLEKKIPENTYDKTQLLKNREGQRFIKTHLPISLLPEQIKNGSKAPKIIYVMRNPKDVCVSYYHLGKLLMGWHTTLNNFCKAFLADKVMYGSFWKHVLGYWEQRMYPNILIIRYEDMKKDLSSVIYKVADFLDKKLTDAQVALLCKHLSFESMKHNRAVNFQDFIDIWKSQNLAIEDGSFMRSGIVGKYKEEYSSEIIDEFDEWIRSNTIGTDFDQHYAYNL